MTSRFCSRLCLNPPRAASICFAKYQISVTKSICKAAPMSTSAKLPQYIFPAERNTHAGTMMAWPTKHSVERFSITATRKEVASIATAIAQYEPLHLFALNNRENITTARAHLGTNKNISIHPVSQLDSLWARDTGPLFLRSGEDGAVRGLVMNFNNWGDKFKATGDAGTATCVLDELNLPAIEASFVAEGGALEFDGEGTLMVTQSSLVDPKRNPGESKEDLEVEFKRYFGVTKTIWVKGVQGYDLTDCHIDALARFVRPGVVVLIRPSESHSNEEKAVYEDAKMRLKRETDATGRKFQLVEISEPEYRQFEGQTVNSYVNYYVANGAVIAPKFGDRKADEEARQVLEKLFPERVVEQVLLKQLPAQGGGIHCATQQILE